MKTNKNRSYKALDKLARSLGLDGERGQFTTKAGMKVDLTAIAETREAIIYTIGNLSLAL